MQIAITGCGWVTPRLAGRIEDVLTAYAQSNHSLAAQYEPIPRSILDQFPNLPGEAGKENSVAIAAIALEFAWKQAGLSGASCPSDRKGLVLGCALAGVSGMIDFANDVRKESPRFVSPIHFPQTVGNYICGAIARGYDFRGPASTIACGSASSLESIREGCALLSSGLADIVVAGGTELLSPELVKGINQPGVCFADGACFFVLESEDFARKRGAKVLAWIGEDESSRGKQTPPIHLISTAAHFEPRAICIEKWTGRTLGADGGAALAAAIGSIAGRVVPCFGEDALEPLKQVDVTKGREEPKPRRMLIRASDDTNHIHELGISVD